MQKGRSARICDFRGWIRHVLWLGLCLPSCGDSGGPGFSSQACNLWRISPVRCVLFSIVWIAGAVAGNFMMRRQCRCMREGTVGIRVTDTNDLLIGKLRSQWIRLLLVLSWFNQTAVGRTQVYRFISV